MRMLSSQCPRGQLNPAPARRLRYFSVNAAFIGASLVLLGAAPMSAGAGTVQIVAIGASNTSGWMLRPADAYPTRLEALLRAKGVEARVINAGVPFSTTTMMLGRLAGDVPASTDIVILQPGANDLRFFGTREARTANIQAMIDRLRARSIKVVVFDQRVPSRYYAWDGIHFSREGHAMIARQLLPRVLDLISTRPRKKRAVGAEN